MLKRLGFALAALALLSPVLASARTTDESPYLYCSSAYPVVSLGNAGRFVAVTNTNGPFEWVMPDYGVIDAGTVFAAPFDRLGNTQVDVVWGSQRATCYVSVVATPGYGEPWPGNQAYSNNYQGTAFSALNVTLSSKLFPYLPNAGFEPQNLAAFAFAVVLLLGSFIALYPHVRKAFAIL